MSVFCKGLFWLTRVTMCGLEMLEGTLIRANTRLSIPNKKHTGISRKNLFILRILKNTNIAIIMQIIF